jgi:hypothetical protein
MKKNYNPTDDSPLVWLRLAIRSYRGVMFRNFFLLWVFVLLAGQLSAGIKANSKILFLGRNAQGHQECFESLCNNDSTIGLLDLNLTFDYYQCDNIFESYYAGRTYPTDNNGLTTKLNEGYDYIIILGKDDRIQDYPELHLEAVRLVWDYTKERGTKVVLPMLWNAEDAVAYTSTFEEHTYRISDALEIDCVPAGLAWNNVMEDSSLSAGQSSSVNSPSVQAEYTLSASLFCHFFERSANGSGYVHGAISSVEKAAIDSHAFSAWQNALLDSHYTGEYTKSFCSPTVPFDIGNRNWGAMGTSTESGTGNALKTIIGNASSEYKGSEGYVFLNGRDYDGKDDSDPAGYDRRNKRYFPDNLRSAAAQADVTNNDFEFCFGRYWNYVGVTDFGEVYNDDYGQCLDALRSYDPDGDVNFITFFRHYSQSPTNTIKHAHDITELLAKRTRNVDGVWYMPNHVAFGRIWAEDYGLFAGGGNSVVIRTDDPHLGGPGKYLQAAMLYTLTVGENAADTGNYDAKLEYVMNIGYQVVTELGGLKKAPGTPSALPEPPTIHTRKGYSSDLTTTGITAQATLTSSGDAAATVTVYWGASNSGQVPEEWEFSYQFNGHTGPAPAGYAHAIANLDPGSQHYYVFKAENAHGAGWSEVVPIFDAISTLTVIGADEDVDGEYEAGAAIELSANVPAGKQFVKWTTSNGGRFVSDISAITTFTMPTNATTVTAIFEYIPTYALTVNNGSDNTGNGPYAADTLVSISAQSAPADHYFSSWTSDNGGTFADASAADTTFTMPSGATAVTANYALITPPEIETSVPSAGATNVPRNTSLTATFDVSVHAGNGNILLKKQSNDEIVESFDVTDTAKVSFSGDTISFAPSNELDLNKTYTIEIPANAIQSQYGAYNNALSWSFTVTNAIVLVKSNYYVTSDSLGATGFDFAANADMIVVAYSSYCNNTTIPVISYGGHPLTKAVLDGYGGKSFAGIWYLDLTTTDYVDGDAELKIDFGASGKATGVGIGVVSLSADGAGIELDGTQEVGDDLKDKSLTLTTTQDGAFNMVSFYGFQSSEIPSIDAKLSKIKDSIKGSTSVPGKDFAAGYKLNVPAGDHTYSWNPKYSRGIAAASFVLRDNSFSSWAEQNNLGVHSGLGDDPDGDGVPNGIEAFFGSHPGEVSSGLIALNVTSEQISFTHPQSDEPPTNLQLSYSWSCNLADWYDCDGIDGPVSRETVSVSSEIVDGTATVTVTPSTETGCLFLRAKVQEK